MFKYNIFTGQIFKDDQPVLMEENDPVFIEYNNFLLNDGTVAPFEGPQEIVEIGRSLDDYS